MSTQNTKDALGNEVEIGKVYAYHRCINGITTNVVGEVIELKEDKAKISVHQRWHAVYGAAVRQETITKNTTTVKANSLFKIDGSIH